MSQKSVLLKFQWLEAMVLDDECHFPLNVWLNHSICHPQLVGHQELGIGFKNRRTLATTRHLGSDGLCKIRR